MPHFLTFFWATRRVQPPAGHPPPPMPPHGLRRPGGGVASTFVHEKTPDPSWMLAFGGGGTNQVQPDSRQDPPRWTPYHGKVNEVRKPKMMMFFEVTRGVSPQNFDWKFQAFGFLWATLPPRFWVQTDFTTSCREMT